MSENRKSSKNQLQYIPIELECGTGGRSYPPSSITFSKNKKRAILRGECDECSTDLSTVVHANKILANRLFVYGTLADPRVQKKIWGRKTNLTPAVLKGYKKSALVIDGETYPLIIPDKTGAVRGFVIDVAADELKKIDAYETKAYRRERVCLENGATAWVYTKR